MKTASTIMIIGSALLLSLFIYPLWVVELEAPQYPDGLGMFIHLNGLQGFTEFDLQNIDGLNHYIGMQTLPKAHEMWEFSVFPIVVGGMAILGIIVGFLGFIGKISHNWFLYWLILMTVLGVLGMFDFNAWMTDYGSNLDPNAIIKVTEPDGTPFSYKPPLLGSRDILNFTAISYPGTGGIFLTIGMFLTFIAYLVGFKTNKK
ncbi:hypothetical protein [Psychroflexus halocasei]|uniref:Copper chaperone NosL n=1 Tax=Psychroflexus halocasei TaxID=908615 RepID=A0A1H3ZNW3_9FLAO|nr:hypothetical protein [Psychroflexus halocasei]SEA25410.1 hypothetical protein SAMN05421540_104152 [Psychroflexus halocasei]